MVFQSAENTYSFANRAHNLDPFSGNVPLIYLKTASGKPQTFIRNLRK